jgi:hypothetical protein
MLSGAGGVAAVAGEQRLPDMIRVHRRLVV